MRDDKPTRIIMPAFLEVQVSVNPDTGSLLVEQVTEEERDIPDMVCIPAEFVSKFVGYVCQVTGVYPVRGKT
jgi:hypothetical protein